MGDDGDGKRLAHVQLHDGVYSAVLNAALGKVRITFYVKVHPFYVLLACIPCLWFQATALFALRTAMEVHPALGVDDINGEDETLGAALWKYPLVRLQVLMIGVFYIMNFPRLLASLKQWVYVMNPLSWVEVCRPRSGYWTGGKVFSLPFSLLFCTEFSACCAAWAAIMKFGIGYIVCVDSVSLILAQGTVIDSIFNCMAITFIIDLDTFWWACVKALFQIEDSDTVVELREDGEVWLGGQLAPSAGDGFSSSLLDLLIWLTTWPKFMPGKRSWLSRPNGFKSVEHFVCLLMLFAMFERQITIVFFALETNVLPVTRDVCTHFELHAGSLKAKTWLGSFTLSLLRQLSCVLEQAMLISARQEFEQLSMTATKGELDCASQKYIMMSSDDAAHIRAKYARVYWAMITAGLAFFFLPMCILKLHSSIFYGNADSAQEDAGDGQCNPLLHSEGTTATESDALAAKSMTLLEGLRFPGGSTATESEALAAKYFSLSMNHI